MVGGAIVSVGTLGIVELGEVCDRQIAAGRGWFETLGAWVRDEPAGDRQQLWAMASHRHAWHADLWTDRRPTIPPVSDRPLPSGDAAREISGEERAVVYGAALADLLAELDDVTAAIDADLDPSTARVIALVRSDLADLADRLESS